MSQLYARVFVAILDSSIAEDFTTRHVFEDFLKLADKNGVVDMTRQAVSRRLNIPIETLNDHILKLEAPDPESRDPNNEGRRILPLDDHRDWGWRIANWDEYEKIKTKADQASRVARHRASFDAVAAITGETSDQAVINAWGQWVQHRKEKRVTITEQTAKKQIGLLNEWGAQRFIAAINHSITKGWTGLFEANANANQGNHPQYSRPLTGAEQRAIGTETPKYDDLEAMLEAKAARDRMAKETSGR